MEQAALGEPLCACWVLCLEAFISLLQAGILGNLGDVSGEGFSRIVICSPDAPFWGQARRSLVSAVGLGVAPLVLLFLGLELNTTEA